jgi:broad specificity phosphatase PhoE
MGCRILFVRHGQSLGNLNGVFLGATDLDLSLLGHKQAENTANYLKSEKIDVIYSSDLLRAYNTAVPTANLKNSKIITDKGLREIFAGKWENKKFERLISEFPESYATIWLHNIGLAHPDGGESVAELENRVYNTILKIAEQNLNKTIAVFTHATPIRTFFNKINGKSLSDLKDLKWPTNSSVSEVIFEDGKFTEVKYSYDLFLGNSTSSLPTNC